MASLIFYLFVLVQIMVFFCIYDLFFLIFVYIALPLVIHPDDARNAKRKRKMLNCTTKMSKEEVLQYN